jgi:hypothetical protein
MKYKCEESAYDFVTGKVPSYAAPGYGKGISDCPGQLSLSAGNS